MTGPTLDTLRAQCLERIAKARRDAWELYKCDLDIRTEFKRGMGRWAGKAECRWGVFRGTITINLDALALDPVHTVNETCPHEVAHIVAYALCRDRGHGKEWRRIAQALGCEGKRCHDIPLAPRGGGHKYRATCGTELVLSTVLHNRIQRGQTRVIPKTGGKITPDCYAGRP